MKITKQMVDSLSSDIITKKDYERIVVLIGEKVDEIWRFILKTSKRRLNWYAFRNDVPYGHGNGSSGGEFDPITDKEFIKLRGDFQINDALEPFGEGFPTEFLWSENYPELVKKAMAEGKKEKRRQQIKAAKNKSDLQKKIELARASIRQKLTSEELKYIEFLYP
jgi:predicted metalloprotease